MTHKLELEGVVVRSAGAALVGPVSLTLDPGDRLTVMGETGAGKSLLAQAIMGTLPRGLTARGHIRVGGSRVDGLAGVERAALWGRTLTLLPQEPWRALDPIMRSGPQVDETYRHVAGVSARAARAAADEALAELDVLPARPRLPGALSGGMAQRIAFAAAKAGGAPLVIADEPTKGLDADRAATVTGLLGRVPDTGGTLLTITHDLRLARHLGGAVLILKDGAVVETGPSATVLSRPSSDYARALLAAEPSAWTLPPAAVSGASVLRAESLTVARGARVLVRDFDLELRQSERVAMAGPSGSGKTSLLDALGRGPRSARRKRGARTRAAGQRRPEAVPGSARRLSRARGPAREHARRRPATCRALDPGGRAARVPRD